MPKLKSCTRDESGPLLLQKHQIDILIPTKTTKMVATGHIFSSSKLSKMLLWHLGSS